MGGVVFNQNDHLELKPRSRKEGVLHYLHALTSLHQSHNNLRNSDSTELRSTDSNYFDDNCARIRQLAKPGSLVYLITDAQQIKDKLIQQSQSKVKLNQEIGALRHLTQISQHCELVVCLITDPLEHKLPVSSTKLNVTLTDGHNRQQLTLGDKESANNYEQQTEIIFDECSKHLAKAGARVISFSAEQTLEKQLKDGAMFCNQ